MRSGSTSSSDMDTISMQSDTGGKDLWFQFGMERELGVHVSTDNNMDSLRDMAYAIIETKVSLIFIVICTCLYFSILVYKLYYLFARVE